MSITLLFRLAMGLALAGAVGIGYARSRRMEAGEPRGMTGRTPWSTAIPTPSPL